MKTIHNLASLWDTAVAEIKGKIPDATLKEYDIAFAHKMVMEFHDIDQRGVRFRYHGDEFGSATGGTPVLNRLHINYEALLAQMDHTLH